jgi:hypothetical protein
VEGFLETDDDHEASRNVATVAEIKWHYAVASDILFFTNILRNSGERLAQFLPSN